MAQTLTVGLRSHPRSQGNVGLYWEKNYLKVIEFRGS